MEVRTVSDLGGALRRARVDAGLTQEELAERVGVGRQWVTLLERGRANPRWENLRVAFDVLGVTLHVELSDSAHSAGRPPSGRASADDASLAGARPEDDVLDLDTYLAEHQAEQ
ncbi:XRE family transcriptional regulator [Intrasporangium oryzae NRRL B-24470]|uniref:XRE family transcriptional regulator n=1 Tax=Intrasporangium oryzae NRRL B-24470 TaxID=1386089 RepID=W9GC65_9MICO|nr:helix-turn-helix transcriptional regulator [Intrasporangium oryzae]EWT01444.1 XRE family transcriptional regulator [Intrasporangium oryzae NRRL B-24470]